MSKRSALATILAVLLVTSVAVPGLVAAEDGALGVEAVQSPTNGDVTVTVTENDASVENASVNVSSTEPYSGNGSYLTDAVGSVRLPNPNETVNVTLNASTDSLTEEKSVELVPYSDSLSVTVQQNASTEPVVTVTQYEEPVENATVTVDGSGPYEGNGTHTTDENGTVTLPVPNETVTVTVTASSDGLVAETRADLRAPSLSVGVEQDEWQRVHINVTYGDQPVDGANVTVSGDYSEAGSYVTDEEGTIELAAPDHNTTISVNATYDDEWANTTASLTTVTEQNQTKPFGQRLVRFIHALKAQEELGQLGPTISTFVHNHNPSSADDDPGPPEHAGPPDHAGPGSDGPPGHADDSDTEDANETVENAENGDDETTNPGHGSQGPPDHANNPDDVVTEPVEDESTENESDDENEPDDDESDEEDADDDDDSDEEDVNDDDNSDEEDAEDENEREDDGSAEDDVDEENESDDDDSKDDETDTESERGHGPPEHANNDT